MQIHFIKKGQLLLLLSFVLLILLGTLLLLIPGVMKNFPGSLSPLDAAFISCSAVCLNGLSLYPHEFSFGGQLILLLLIQCGCLGILSLSAALVLILGKQLSFGNALLLNNINDNFSLRDTESLIRLIFRYTIFCESLGTILMFPAFWLHGGGAWFVRIGRALWYSLFFSIGSFCNAGIGPLPDSMASVGRYIQSVAMIQIVLGGLGMYVVFDILQRWKHPRPHLRLHSRIVIFTSAVLIAGGAILLWTLSRIPGGTSLSWFDALFFSVASRTTGYFTVSPGLLSHSCLALLIVLMVIGGSPGSCAGGIKTSTLAVIVATLVSSFRGNTSVIIGRRTIPMRCVLRAFAVATVFLASISAGALLLAYFAKDPSGVTMPGCFFEAASALTATGYSLTETALLQRGLGSKLLLILFMFAGRVGPLTIILFLAGREKSGALRYPEEKVIVG